MTSDGGFEGARVRLVRTFNTGIDHLFACFADPVLVARWWGPRSMHCPHAENDFRVGGRYRFEMQDDDTASRIAVIGEYLEIDRPHRIVCTWQWEGTPDEVTRLALVFNARGPRATVLELTHDRFPSTDRAGAHEQGWESSLDGLAAVLAA